MPIILIYLVGGWVNTGPGYNDTVFAPEYITFDKDDAVALAELNEWSVFEASPGTEFVDWTQIDD